MAISRFQSAFKVRTDMMDNITPNNTVQMNASVPAGEWKPASWLPVIWQNEASKDYFTISSGKVVSFDSTGRVVPAGLLRRLEGAKGDTFIEYTAEDVKARVIDIETGDFVTAAKVVKNEDAMVAVISHGWVITDEVPTDDDASCQAVGALFISAPVGVAAYDVYAWAGDDPANLHFTNYQKQHLIQFFTDIQMRVGHVCDATAEDVFGANTLKSGAQLGALHRYSHLDMSASMAYEWTSKLASHTSRTPVVAETAQGAWSGRERSDIGLLVKAGDWYLDGDAGRVIFFQAAGAAQAPIDANGDALTALTAFDYAGAASAQEQMMHFVGDCKPGDFVTFDENSNFVARSLNWLSLVAGGTEGDIEAGLGKLQREQELTVGRLLELQKEPRGLLERVRTGWKGEEFGADAKMPGSATKGFSDLITLSDEVIADEIAIVNVKIQ
jgi:hypothetical protein